MKKANLQTVYFVVVVISVLSIIFLGTEKLFHSDDATAVLVAREQILQKKLIIEDWNHGTTLWTVGLQTFIIPFLIIIKDWILCREFAVILQTILFLIVVYKIIKILEIRNRFFVLALCICPVSEEILEHTLFQAAYLTLQLFYYAIILSLFYFYKSLHEKNKKSAFAGCFSLIAIVIGIHSNLAAVAVITVPILGAVILYFFIENYILFHRVKPDKKVLCVSSVVLISTVIGIGVYMWLCRITGYEFNNSGASEFMGKTGYGLKIADYIDQFLLLYGGVGEASLFSLEGILRLVRILYLMLLCFITPCYLLMIYKKLNSMQKLFLLYSVIVYGILSVVALSTGKCSSRYFIPVYFNNIVLFGIATKKMHDTVYCVFARVIQTGVMALVIGCCFFYSTYDYSENKNDIGMWRSNGFNTADQDLVEFLKQNEIQFIYASYWNAYSNMVISDGNIKAIAFDGCEPMETRKWLNSNRWNQPEYYNGKTAIIFLPTVELKDIYWELASEHLKYKEWNILVFDKNLLLYDEIAKLQNAG